MTQTQLANHARSVVNQIDPARDVSALSAKFTPILASEIPKPVLYYNYHVGECKDLIFGVGLVDYATARCLADLELPKIVRICIKEIDQRGLKSEGIYRVRFFVNEHVIIVYFFFRCPVGMLLYKK